MLIEHRRYYGAECDCLGELHVQIGENGDACDCESFNRHDDFFGVARTGGDH